MGEETSQRLAEAQRLAVEARLRLEELARQLSALRSDLEDAAELAPKERRPKTSTGIPALAPPPLPPGLVEPPLPEGEAELTMEADFEVPRSVGGHR